jgi:hypothetical protein
MKTKKLIFIISLVLTFNSNAQDTKIQYKTYCNSLYPFCADYPSTILIPQGESDSRDGQIFISKNEQNELRVYRTFIDNGDESYIDLKVQYGKEIKRNLKSITYKKLSKDFFVVSGYNAKGQIYYQKTYLFEKDLYTCILTYNVSEKELYNKIAEHIFKSFKMPLATNSNK